MLSATVQNISKNINIDAILVCWKNYAMESNALINQRDIHSSVTGLSIIHRIPKVYKFLGNFHKSLSGTCWSETENKSLNLRLTFDADVKLDKKMKPVASDDNDHHALIFFISGSKHSGECSPIWGPCWGWEGRKWGRRPPFWEGSWKGGRIAENLGIQ